MAAAPPSVTGQPEVSINSIHHLEIERELAHWDSGTAKAFLDEANKELIIAKPSGKITRVSFDGTKTHRQYNIVASDLKSVKYSLDNTYLALQHNDKEIEFIRVQDESRFVVPCTKTGKIENKILGFYWVNMTNFVVITKHTVEFYALTKPNSYSKVKDFKMAVNWFIYSAGVRILLVSTGQKENTMNGFHFTLRFNTIIKLPKFDVELYDGKEVLKEAQLTISQIYSRVYLIHNSAKHRQLHLYQLTKDVVEKKVVIDLHAYGQVYLSVVDNIIISHNVTQKVSMLFDINAKAPKDLLINFPLAAPLPAAPFRDATNNEDVEPYDDWTFHLPRFVINAKKGRLYSLRINLDAICLSFSDRIRLVDFLLRRINGKALLMLALTQLIEEKELLTTVSQIFDMLNDVLQVYQQEQAAKAAIPMSQPVPNNVDSPNLSGEKRPVTLDLYSSQGSFSATSASILLKGASGSGFDLVTASAATLDLGSKGEVPDLVARRTAHYWAEFKDQQQRQQGGAVDDAERKQKEADQNVAAIQQLLLRQLRTSDGKIVIEQEDLYAQVFVPIEEKGSVDNKYLASAIAEYIRSISFHKMRVQSFIYELVIDLLVRNNRFYQLHQWMQFFVISDSVHVACQLLSIGAQYPPAIQLAFDIFKRLNEPMQIIEVLLAKGLLQHGMRFIRALPPTVEVKPFVPRFLAEAKRSADSTLFYITYQFFKQRGEVDSLACVEYKEYYQKKFSQLPEDPTGLINGMEVERPQTGGLSLSGTGFAAAAASNAPLSPDGKL